MFFDLPIAQLRTYLPDRQESVDFDEFWAETLDEARGHPLNPRFEPTAAGLRLLDVYNVTYSGYGGQPIKAWLLLPRQRSQPLPCVVQYIGYGGGRSNPHNWLLFPAAGYALLVMDTRGQGSVWLRGDTPDLERDGGNAQHPGFMTRGILNPATYYYRRVFTDAVRAVETARSYPAVDAGRVAVSGNSQGGGISLAVGGLLPGISAVFPDVPFLCHYRRATELVDTHPYNEIARFCKIHRRQIETVFDTLSYFDGVNFAARAAVPALFSAGLMDDICPPSTVFAAYNHYAGRKQIEIYPYNQHEGGESDHEAVKVAFLSQLWSEA